jgi:membrane protein implicated in regulation of membrane protease activity
MTWSDFYLICFAVGFLFSFVSFIAGGLHWHVHMHMPDLPDASIGGGHLGVGHGADVHIPSGHGADAGGHGQQSGQVSPLNFVTLTVFLAWFGGTGYLITRFSSLWFALGLLLATGAGLLGAAIVFLFMSRVLMSREENMKASDYEMVGVLGRTSMPIREGGTGEIIYSQAGTRRTCGARSEDGNAIAKGVEVMVTRYDKGIAYVQPWEEVSGE